MEKMLIPKLGFLKSLGVSMEEAMAMVLRRPICFTFSIENNFKPKFLGTFLLIVLSSPNLPSTPSPLIFYDLFISAVIKLVLFASIVKGNFFAGYLQTAWKGSFNTCVFVKKPFEGLFGFIVSSTTPVSLHRPTASKSATYTL
ncbi:hypothetical protein TorRG33x02_108780 [Trema orientale]|uniref:Mitochodrial transcription termination factor n=1 Tax=Trema orientale TaxID=63057 RepID=A0A2P5F688_TREOI|nr:hypothetical protein TorRG33x02_108780 [Trema orientale]